MSKLPVVDPGVLKGGEGGGGGGGHKIIDACSVVDPGFSKRGGHKILGACCL